MKDIAQNMIHDKKRFHDISLLKFMICQCLKNSWNCEQWFIKDLVENVIHDKKRFDDTSLLELVNCQFQIILETVNSGSWKMSFKMWYMIRNVSITLFY